MKTEDAMVNWVKNVLWSYPAKGGFTANSCHGEGLYFLSYSTPIAKCVNGKIQVSTRKFSCTTSKHQGILRRMIPNDLLEVVDDIDDGGLFPCRR